jgi:hypothetical protein
MICHECELYYTLIVSFRNQLQVTIELDMLPVWPMICLLIQLAVIRDLHMNNTIKLNDLRHTSLVYDVSPVLTFMWSHKYINY